jgi:hypothetical protein
VSDFPHELWSNNSFEFSRPIEPFANILKESNPVWFVSTVNTIKGEVGDSLLDSMQVPSPKLRS